MSYSSREREREVIKKNIEKKKIGIDDVAL